MWYDAASAQRMLSRPVAAWEGQRHLGHAGPQLPQHVDCRFAGGGHGVVAGLPEGVARQPDAQAPQLATQCAGVVVHGLVRAAGVLAVVAGDGVEDDCRVLHALGQRPHVVQRPRQRQHSATAHAPVGGQQPHHAAQRRRDPDRSPRVCAQRPQARPGGDRRTAPPAAATRHVRRVPGIVHGPVVRVDAGGAQGELVQRQLARQHDARVLEFLCDEPVFAGHAVAQEAGARGGGDPRRVVEIL